MAKNTICLWYDKDAEAAARFYAETCPKPLLSETLSPNDMAVDALEEAGDIVRRAAK